MALGDGIRRDVATVSQAERDLLLNAFLELDTTKFYPDGVSYWDKQEDIHKNAHFNGVDVHAGPAFIPWHRVLVNRLEELIREVHPELSLHYWDWTTDPRAASAGRAALFTPQFMGGTGNPAGPPFQNFESTEKTDPFDSAAPLGSLACQIHGSQRSTEGRPADLHHEGRGGTLAVSDSVRDGTGAVCRSQGRQRIAVGLRDIVAVHTAGPWTTAIASHARVVPMAIT
jgi:hypothetical protein